MIKAIHFSEPAPIHRRSYAVTQEYSSKKNPPREKYNLNCRRFCKNSDGPYCAVGADMKFCSKNCAFVK